MPTKNLPEKIKTKSKPRRIIQKAILVPKPLYKDTDALKKAAIMFVQNKTNWNVSTSEAEVIYISKISDYYTPEIEIFINSEFKAIAFYYGLKVEYSSLNCQFQTVSAIMNFYENIQICGGLPANNYSENNVSVMQHMVQTKASLLSGNSIKKMLATRLE